MIKSIDVLYLTPNIMTPETEKEFEELLPYQIPADDGFGFKYFNSTKLKSFISTHFIDKRDVKCSKHPEGQELSKRTQCGECMWMSGYEHASATHQNCIVLTNKP